MPGNHWVNKTCTVCTQQQAWRTMECPSTPQEMTRALKNFLLGSNLRNWDEQPSAFKSLKLAITLTFRESVDKHDSYLRSGVGEVMLFLMPLDLQLISDLKKLTLHRRCNLLAKNNETNKTLKIKYFAKHRLHRLLSLYLETRDARRTNRRCCTGGYVSRKLQFLPLLDQTLVIKPRREQSKEKRRHQERRRVKSTSYKCAEN